MTPDSRGFVDLLSRTACELTQNIVRVCTQRKALYRQKPHAAGFAGPVRGPCCTGPSTLRT